MARRRARGCATPKRWRARGTLPAGTFLTLPLARVDAPLPRSRLLSIDASGHTFTFLPGQAVMMGTHDAAVRRPFSIDCSPERRTGTKLVEMLQRDSAGSARH